MSLQLVCLLFRRGLVHTKMYLQILLQVAGGIECLSKEVP